MVRTLYEAHVTTYSSCRSRLPPCWTVRSRFRLAVWPQANILCFQFVPTNFDNREVGSLNARIREAIVQQEPLLSGSGPAWEAKLGCEQPYRIGDHHRAFRALSWTKLSESVLR